MIDHTRKFFIYTRKSTDTEDRQVRSISDQLAELKELALKEQIEVVDIFVEKQTAKAPGRPVFNEMLLRIEANEASGILAWHPDRLARNSVDGGKVIYLVDTGVIHLKHIEDVGDRNRDKKIVEPVRQERFNSSSNNSKASASFGVLRLGCTPNSV